jgi:hypothetical protein
LGRKGGSLKEERHRQHIRREQAAFLERIGRGSLHPQIEKAGRLSFRGKVRALGSSSPAWGDQAAFL